MTDIPPTDTPKLLPCPFCGDDGMSHGWSAPGIRGGASDGHVECMECGALVIAGPTEQDAIAAWNRRTTPTLPDVAARAAEVMAVDHSALFAKLVEAEAKAHTLKCWPEPFAAMLDGGKTAEFRPDDRGFCVGDYLLLREWNSDTQTYTGRSIERRITHILRNSFGVPDGFAMLSLASDGLPALIAAQEAKDAEIEWLKRGRGEEWDAYMTNAVSSAPEPLRQLGEYLAGLLDEDQWPTAERYLNAAALTNKGTSE